MTGESGHQPTADPAVVGALIRQRRLARLISSPAALSTQLKEAGYSISGSRIHDIEQGHTRTGKPTNASPVALVQLALVLGISAKELETVGRQDAAEVLRQHLQQNRAEQGVPSSITDAIEDGLAQIRANPHLSPQQKTRLEEAFLEQYERSARSVTETISDALKALGNNGA